eukprot:CAMPEP_0184391560 /NCGR_PEP_ID=MMETSP0007-20130409/14197_1 /TAXON_ID=97485 /ORGANISM="Prymnesium parvum, Strain Texoma1" /LENGTH=102 /DNA_ID=CAMNT_0026741727 /DNA_START=323 /DNA_END=627 /DNA_ORIENTATION=+
MQPCPRVGTQQHMTAANKQLAKVAARAEIVADTVKSPEARDARRLARVRPHVHERARTSSDEREYGANYDSPPNPFARTHWCVPAPRVTLRPPPLHCRLTSG